MNVIETVKELLTNYDKMDEFNGVHIDYTESENNVCGMFPVGPTKTGEDIVGNSKYKVLFEVYAQKESFDDYNRLQNSGFLSQLTYHLNSLKNISVTETIEGEEKTGRIKSIDAGNALLYDIPTGDINDGIRYQIQITVNYVIYD